MPDDRQKDVKKDRGYRQPFVIKERKVIVQKPVEQVKNQRHEKTSIETYKEYNRILNIDSIARRYIAMNGFDGVLAILGIVISSFIAGVADVKLIISVCLGAAVAMAVSGVWGAYMAEAAERKKELKELEGSMLTRLKKTKIGRAGDFAALVIALIDGAAPFIAGIFVIMPFILLPINIAYYVSFVIAFALLFLLGIFLGKISKENLILSGIKMLFAGVVIMIIVFLLGASGHK
ncbi:MAG: hypothetical protein HY831_05380 [Candidatus Aenigmarchaeota archaeon]|nr:hypothetical protein [Candidatus Aenigmarchaeota archaeon]